MIFLNALIIILSKSMMAFSHSEFRPMVTVHFAGTSSLMKSAWTLWSEFRIVFWYPYMLIVWLASSIRFSSIIDKLTVVFLHMSTCWVVSSFVQYKHLVGRYFESYSFFYVIMGSLLYNTFVLNILILALMNEVLPHVIFPSLAHATIVAFQSVFLETTWKFDV